MTMILGKTHTVWWADVCFSGMTVKERYSFPTGAYNSHSMAILYLPIEKLHGLITEL